MGRYQLTRNQITLAIDFDQLRRNFQQGVALALKAAGLDIHHHGQKPAKAIAEPAGGGRRIHALQHISPLCGQTRSSRDATVAATPTPEIGRATSELQSLMRISYAVFCLK